ALIFGGAVGNLIDRAVYGHVIDYILFHTPVWSFAVFNLADTFITLGAGLVILDEFVGVGQRAGLPATDRTADQQEARVKMPDSFKAILISRDENKKQSVEIVNLIEVDLMEGDVTVAVEVTPVNNKDGLAITG